MSIEVILLALAIWLGLHGFPLAVMPESVLQSWVYLSQLSYRNMRLIGIAEFAVATVLLYFAF